MQGRLLSSTLSKGLHAARNYETQIKYIRIPTSLCKDGKMETSYLTSAKGEKNIKMIFFWCAFCNLFILTCSSCCCIHAHAQTPLSACNSLSGPSLRFCCLECVQLPSTSFQISRWSEDLLNPCSCTRLLSDQIALVKSVKVVSEEGLYVYLSDKLSTQLQASQMLLSRAPTETLLSKVGTACLYRHPHVQSHVTYCMLVVAAPNYIPPCHLTV